MARLSRSKEAVSLFRWSGWLRMPPGLAGVVVVAARSAPRSMSIDAFCGFVLSRITTFCLCRELGWALAAKAPTIHNRPMVKVRIMAY